MNTTNCQKPIVENDAYYSRVMSSDVIARIKNEFAWILEYVERHPELDYQTGSNASDSWFSIYRGTGRLFTIKKDKVLAHPEYEHLCKEFYKHPSPETLDCLLSKVTDSAKLGRYYISKGKKKEGYYQNLISRRYSLFCKESDDFIIIDCPPSLNILTLNALTAADQVIVPVQCEYYALEGLTQLIYTINLVKKSLNPDLSIAGLVFTMFDSRTNLSQDVVDNVKENVQQYIYKTIIPRNIRLAEAPSYGLPIIMYDPKSSGAHAYKKLAKEVIAQNKKKIF